MNAHDSEVARGFSPRLSAPRRGLKHRATFCAVAALFLFGAFLPRSNAAAELPGYRPAAPVTGVLRVTGNDQMAALLARWEAGFQKHHPAVRFENTLNGSAAAMYGLDLRTADFALMGRPVFPYERYGTYERSWVFPLEVEVATGSAAALRKSPAYAIFVHRDNPLARLTLKQLDGIFGAERGGGWNALSWDTNVARTARENLRTWKQLGVTGPLAEQPIHPYGQANLGAGAITFFQTRVFGGGAMWNPALREYSDRTQMIADLARDPAGIAYAPLAYASAGVKAVALAESDAGPFITLTPATVADRTYPLHRPVYLYYMPDDGHGGLNETRGDPRVKEFLRYILSADGQRDVAGEGSYLPLPFAAIAAQQRKLDSREIPPERAVLGTAPPPAAPVTAAPALTKIRLATDDDIFLPALAEALGHFRAEGLEIVPVKVDSFEKEDYLLQAPLNRGEIDACIHWFQHAVFGARHNLPVKAVMIFNDAPGMTVLVANRVKNEIHTAADFAGRAIAQGAGYGTKSVLTSYLAARAGLAPGRYTPVLMGTVGRQEAVLAALRAGTVDVMTFQEPITSALRETGLVSTLYDLNSRDSTVAVLGAPFPAQCLLMAPGYLTAQPATAQRLVNALVRTMRWLNAHTADEIVAALPASYFATRDRSAEIQLLRRTLPTFARGDFSTPLAAARLTLEIIRASRFDDSEEGRWRRDGENARVVADDLYVNDFVARAMRAIK